MTLHEKKIWTQCLLLPPIISIFISLSDLLKNRTKNSLYRFLFCYVTIIAYWYVAYDTILKFYGVTLKKISHFDNWWDGDPLSTLATICNPFVDYYYFMFVYWMLSGYFFYSMIAYNYSRKLSFVAIALIIFGLNLTNWANLTYFTLSCTFTIFASEYFKDKILYFIPIICISYLLHPGMLLCLLPSIPLFYLWKLGQLKLSLLYLACYGYFSYLFFHSGFDIYIGSKRFTKRTYYHIRKLYR